MSILDGVKALITEGQQRTCRHQYTFVAKRPIGNQAIKFEWVYLCNKCQRDQVQDHPMVPR